MIFEAGQTYYFKTTTYRGGITGVDKWTCLKVGKRFLIFKTQFEKEYRITIKEMERKELITLEEYQCALKMFKAITALSAIDTRFFLPQWPYDPGLVNELSTNVNALKQTLDRLKGVSSCPSS